MKTNIKVTNITLTPAISDYIEKKVDMLEKFFEGEEVLARVEIGKTTKHHKSGDVFKAEVHLIFGGYDHYAVAERDDLYAAIDEVKDEIARGVTSKKKKTMSLIRRGGGQIKNIIKGLRDFGGRGWRRFRRRN